ncbi:glycosyltransferase family 4 protein [Clostridium sp. 19966]|uniref:glycosyltransferase family 4 protein n=1 Tax=Clostridium sp. 19966 TaxID=2768166 RepID=UPI0028EFF505|nr:glycosyltransferase family 4 protein [Clostridium sp. 19966]
MQYLKTRNVNLIKDMGTIPFKLYSKHGIDASVVTYKNGEYPYLNNEVKGLKIDFVKKVFHSFTLDGARYLLLNSKKIDVLHIFHCTLSSVVYSYTYKLINPKGKIYLKLDCSHKLVERIRGLSSFQIKFLNKFLNKVDLISVEQVNLFNQLKELLPQQNKKMINVPNGIDYDYLNRNKIFYDYSKKENTIVYVARIGAEEKNTQLLLEAFAKIPNIDGSDWTLKLIGPIEEYFKEYIQDYFKKYPKLTEKVVFTGEISDRKSLYEEYRKSKICALTSDFESFAIALIEAASMGNIIISTDVGIARELVREDNGQIVPIKDVDAFSKALYYFINNEDNKKLCDKSAEICKENFDWNNIVSKLYDSLLNLG